MDKQILEREDKSNWIRVRPFGHVKASDVHVRIKGVKHFFLKSGLCRARGNSSFSSLQAEICKCIASSCKASFNGSGDSVAGAGDMCETSWPSHYTGGVRTALLQPGMWVS